MKQLSRLLLPLLAIGGLLPGCSPRAYSGFLAPAPPAAVAVRPVLAAATVAVPLAAIVALPPARLARVAPVFAQTMPAARPQLVRVTRTEPNASTKSSKPLLFNVICRSAATLKPRPTMEVAGMQTGGERLAKLALLVVLAFILLGYLLRLLIKAIVHAVQTKRSERSAN